MVRLCKSLLKDAGTGLSKTLSEILVCPLSKQPLRYPLCSSLPPLLCLLILFLWLIKFGRFSEETASLISDSIGVSFPVSYNSSFPFLIWHFHSLLCLGSIQFAVIGYRSTCWLWNQKQNITFTRKLIQCCKPVRYVMVLELMLEFFMFACGLIDKRWDPMFGAKRWEDTWYWWYDEWCCCGFS